MFRYSLIRCVLCVWVVCRVFSSVGGVGLVGLC